MLNYLSFFIVCKIPCLSKSMITWLYLYYRFFPFNMLNVFCHSLMPFKFSTEKPAESPVEAPLLVTSCFSLVSLKGLSLSLIFYILIMHLGVVLFGLILFCILCLLGLEVFFPRLKKFSVIISSNKLFATFCLVWEFYHMNVSKLDVIPEVS